MNKICFREEAKDWNEALPIGNGFLGANGIWKNRN